MSALACAVACALAVACAGCSSSDDTSSGTGATTGTGSSNPQGSASSCDLKADTGYCLDFAADAPSGSAQGNCDSAKTTLGYTGIVKVDGACPTENRVGTCVAKINSTTVTYRYYSGKFTTDSAQKNCGFLPNGGTFTAN